MTDAAPRKKLTAKRVILLVLLLPALWLVFVLSMVGCSYMKMLSIQDQIGAEQDAARAAGKAAP